MSNRVIAFVLAFAAVVVLTYIGVRLWQRPDERAAGQEAVETLTARGEGIEPARDDKAAPPAAVRSEPPAPVNQVPSGPLDSIDTNEVSTIPSRDAPRTTETAPRVVAAAPSRGRGGANIDTRDRGLTESAPKPEGSGATGETHLTISATNIAVPQTPAAPTSGQAVMNESPQLQDDDDGPPDRQDETETAAQVDPPAGTPTRRDDDVPEPGSVPVVRMLPSAAEVQVGDQVSIVIEISGATDVGHVPFHVTMNPQVLQFEYGEEGNFLSSDGRQTAFFAAATSDAAAVVVGLSRIRQGDGIRGGGDLCVLHFIAVGPGNAGLGFARAKVRDSSNRIVPAEFWGTVLVVR